MSAKDAPFAYRRPEETPAEHLSRLQRLLTSRIVDGVYPWGTAEPPRPLPEDDEQP